VPDPAGARRSRRAATKWGVNAPTGSGARR
jgi:hypothetical protein